MSNGEKQDYEKVPKTVIVVLVLGVLALIGAISDKTNRGGMRERASPDGTGWYKDTGLTNAQMLEIAEFCRDNPDSFKCQ